MGNGYLGVAVGGGSRGLGSFEYKYRGEYLIEAYGEEEENKTCPTCGKQL